MTLGVIVLAHNSPQQVFALIGALRHPQGRVYLRLDRTVQLSCASEFFVQSILVATSFARGHDVVNDDLWYTIWTPGRSHPEVLTENHRDAMHGSGKLFARKFDETVDCSVIHELTGRIAHGG